MKLFERTLSPALLVGVLALPVAANDVVHLRNGNRIVGTVLEGTVQGDGIVVVKVEPHGSLTFRGRDVVAIESATTTDSAGDDFLAVTLNSGSTFYGEGTYFGRESTESDDKTLVLAVENAGVVRIPRDAIAVVETVTAPTAKDDVKTSEDGVEEIATEHKLHLRNGRVLQGTLVGGAEDEPLRLRLGNLGVMAIPQNQIERLEHAPDVYKLPAASEVAPTETEDGAGAELPAESLEEMKEQIRLELMRELLDSVIESKLEQRLDEVLSDATGIENSLERGLANQLTNEEILRVEDLVRDLSRQRNTFRVRAERKLVALGHPVLPFLRGVANHPFKLTRRAVQRIVRDVADVRGAPIAISALNDPDQFVRRIAGFALHKLFPDSGVVYHDYAPPSYRLQAQQEYRKAWENYLRESTRVAVHQG